MSSLLWNLFAGLALSVTTQGLGLACLYLSSGSEGYIILQAVVMQLYFVDRYSVLCVALLNSFFLWYIEQQRKAPVDDCGPFLKKSE